MSCHTLTQSHVNNKTLRAEQEVDSHYVSGNDGDVRATVGIAKFSARHWCTPGAR